MDGDPRTGKTAAEPLVLSAATPVNVEGILDYGTVVFAENPTTLLEARDFHGYEFDGRTGGIVTITPADMEMRMAGIMPTSPSPMVSSVYFLAASATGTLSASQRIFTICSSGTCSCACLSVPGEA